MIASDDARPGQKLPSEADLVQQFSISRLTVQRAMKDLQHEGMIVRRAGSGTYVAGREGGQGHVFGLLIPGLGETEIFEPICQGMSRGAQARGHALLWGDTTYGNDEGQIAELCEYYIGRKVSGIFFAPLELRPTRMN